MPVGIMEVDAVGIALATVDFDAGVFPALLLTGFVVARYEREGPCD